jgi:hypothetical protein
MWWAVVWPMNSFLNDPRIRLCKGFIVIDPLNVDWIEYFSIYLSIHASLTFVTAETLPLFLIRQMTVEPLAKFEFLLGYWKVYSHYVGEVVL